MHKDWRASLLAFCFSFLQSASPSAVSSSSTKAEHWKKKRKANNTDNSVLGQQSLEKLVQRAPILDANSGCGGRPGLLKCISAHKSANVRDFVFFHIFGVARMHSSFNQARFSDDSRLLRLACL